MTCLAGCKALGMEQESGVVPDLEKHTVQSVRERHSDRSSQYNMLSDQMDACLFGSRDLAKNDLAESTLAPRPLGNVQLRMLLPGQCLFPLLVRAPRFPFREALVHSCKRNCV